MKTVMILSKNEEVISKLQSTDNKVLTFDNFITVFEELDKNAPDIIIFDFTLIDFNKQFMLESLPKKNENGYIKLVAIGNCKIKEKMADFSLKFSDSKSFNSAIVIQSCI